MFFIFILKNDYQSFNKIKFPNFEENKGLISKLKFEIP